MLDRHVTLVADTVTTVELTITGPSDPLVRVVSHGDSDSAIYVTGDGTDPTVGGDDCLAIPGGAISRRDIPVTVARDNLRAGSATATVKLISAGTPTLSLEILP